MYQRSLKLRKLLGSILHSKGPKTKVGLRGEKCRFVSGGKKRRRRAAPNPDVSEDLLNRAA